MSEIGIVEGKTFLITGAASGLGAGYIEEFLKDGAKSIAILDIAEEIGKETAKRYNKSYPGKVIFVKCNVASEESITAAFNEVLEKFKTIDVIINNAGIMNDSPDVWRTATDVNYQGVVSFTLKGLKHMRVDEGGKGGTIINIASVLAFMKIPYLPIYAGAKAAVLQFSYCFGADPFHERTGVRVLTISYGATDTPLLHNLGNRSYDEFGGKELETTYCPGYMQKRESAIKGLVDVYKRGPNGTAWMITDDKPAEDMSHLIEAGYNSIIKALYPDMAQ